MLVSITLVTRVLLCKRALPGLVWVVAVVYAFGAATTVRDISRADAILTRRNVEVFKLAEGEGNKRYSSGISPALLKKKITVDVSQRHGSTT